MFVPEFLYQLSARDQQVTWLDPIARVFVASVAAATVIPSFTVPTDRVFILTNSHISGVGGGAQTVARIALALTPPGGLVAAGPNVDVEGLEVPGAPNIARLSWTGELMVPPAWMVSAIVLFSAGAVANTVNLNLNGCLIPVANIQRV